MLTLTAHRGSRCRTLTTTQTCNYAFNPCGIHAQHWLRFATGVNINHISGLSRAVATSSRIRTYASPSELDERSASKPSRQIGGEPPKLKTEAWYNQYLSMSVLRSTRPRLRLDSIKVVVSDSELNSVLRENPLEFLKSKPLEHADLRDAGKFFGRLHCQAQTDAWRNTCADPRALR